MTQARNLFLNPVWISAAAVLLLCSAAWSNTVRLKRGLVVDPGQRVLLADIADLDGVYALTLEGTVVAAEAGDLLGAGGTGEIDLDRVRGVLHREGAVIGRLAFSGSACRLRSTEVGRPAEREAEPEAAWRTLDDWRAATEQTVEIAIVRRFMRELGVPAERLRLRFLEDQSGLVGRSATDERTVIRPISTISSAVVLLRVERYARSGSLELTDTIKVEAQVLRAVLKLREQVSRREVIPGGRLEASEQWLAPSVDAVDASEAHSMVGQIAQTRLEAGVILLRSQVEEPIAVERNALVEMIYHGNGFVLKSRGRSREAGRRGEIIEVRVEDSKSSVLARVDGPGRVIVLQ